MPNRSNGFTLIELLVTISIMAILAGSVMVGFGAFGNAITAKEVAAMISDTIKQSQLAVLKGDFEKVTFHFFADHLIAVEQAAGDRLSLGADISGNFAICSNGRSFTVAENGTLSKLDERDQALGVANAPPGPFCVTGFAEANELEWRYRLTSANGPSPMVRFVRFGGASFRLGMGAPGGPIADIGDNLYRLEFSAPYAKRQPSDSITFTLMKEGTPTTQTLTL